MDVVESRPDVGSSKMINEGSVIISYPIDVYFLSLFEMLRLPQPPTCVFLHSCRLSLRRIFSTTMSMASSFIEVFIFAAKVRSSFGVSDSARMSSCWTKAPNFPKSPALRTLSLMLTVPLTYEPFDR